jgi:hypothetical protein
MLNERSLPLLIQKQKDVADPIKEKRDALFNNRPRRNQNSSKIYTKSKKWD